MLQKVPEGWNIILAGKWNLNILSPIWISQYLFDSREIALEVLIEPGAVPRFSCESTYLMAAPGRIIFGSTMLDDSGLQSADRAACNLLEALPHTPMLAAGVNFAYRADIADVDFQQHFADTDKQRFIALGKTVVGRTFRWSMQHDADVILNLACVVLESEVKFDFNFNAVVPNARLAKERIEGRILSYRVAAGELLSSAFQLQE